MANRIEPIVTNTSENSFYLQDPHKKRKRDVLLETNKTKKEASKKKKKEKTNEENSGFISSQKSKLVVSLDILSRFYDIKEKSFRKPSQSKLESIIKENNISDLIMHDIENMKFPSHFSVRGKRLARIIQYTLYGLGVVLNKKQTNPLFEKKSGVIKNIENLLYSYVKTCNITNLMKGLEQEGLTFNKNYTTFLQSKEQLFNDQSKLSSEEIKTLTLQSIHGTMLSAIIRPFRDSNSNSEMELSRHYFAPIMSFTTLFDGCTGGS